MKNERSEWPADQGYHPAASYNTARTPTAESCLGNDTSTRPQTAFWAGPGGPGLGRGGLGPGPRPGLGLGPGPSGGENLDFFTVFIDFYRVPARERPFCYVFLIIRFTKYRKKH